MNCKITQNKMCFHENDTQLFSHILFSTCVVFLLYTRPCFMWFCVLNSMWGSESFMSVFVVLDHWHKTLNRGLWIRLDPPVSPWPDSCTMKRSDCSEHSFITIQHNNNARAFRSPHDSYFISERKNRTLNLTYHLPPERPWWRSAVRTSRCRGSSP